MWQNLALNLCVISSAVLAWQLVSDRLDALLKRRGQVGMGMVFGLAGCLSMALAEPLIPGFIFDLRAAMVACATFFGGPLAALPALVLTGSYRIAIGGPGVMGGLLSLASVTFVALVYRRRVANSDASAGRLVVFSVMITAGLCTGYGLVPSDKLVAVLSVTLLPMISLNFVATLLVAMLCAREVHRRELMLSKQIFQQMVELLPDSLNAKDVNGRFIAANPACARLQGLGDPRELIGLSDADFFEGARLAEFQAVDGRVIETGEPLTVEQQVRIEGRDPVHVQTQKVPIQDEFGEVIGLITHNLDITEARRLSRMKSEFVSMVSHELRTPLTSVRGSLGLLSAALGTSASPAARRLLDIANRNSERLVRLINDILDVEKIGNGNLDFEFETGELAPLIRDALPSYANYMPEQKVTLAFVDEAPGARVKVDAARFEQVLSNLVSNAVKFSEPGGTVTIGIARRDGQVVLSVSDTGRGIPEHFRDRVFSRFEQVDASDSRQKGGTGLGLHIAKVIVEKMGGRVSFVSEEGQGTTFFVAFPEPVEAGWAATDDGMAGTTSGAGRSASGDGDKRVLYVEDDTSLAQMMAETPIPGVRVDHVATVAAARAALRAADYDLLLIDNELPDGTGLSLIAEAGPDVPSILFTAREVRGPLPPQVRARFVKTRTPEAEVIEHIRNVLGRPAEPLSRSA